MKAAPGLGTGTLLLLVEALSGLPVLSRAASTTSTSHSRGPNDIATLVSGSISDPVAASLQPNTFLAPARAAYHPFARAHRHNVLRDRTAEDLPDFTGLRQCFASQACRDEYGVLQRCFDQEGPIEDPNGGTEQDVRFRTCVCEDFRVNSKNSFAKCVGCFGLMPGVDERVINYMTTMLLGFCTVEDPNAYLFITSALNATLHLDPLAFSPSANSNPPLTGPITSLAGNAALRAAFTADPLANLPATWSSGFESVLPTPRLWPLPPPPPAASTGEAPPPPEATTGAPQQGESSEPTATGTGAASSGTAAGEGEGIVVQPVNVTGARGGQYPQLQPQQQHEEGEGDGAAGSGRPTFTSGIAEVGGGASLVGVVGVLVGMGIAAVLRV
ncbi:hypothetical protein BDY21DRAFT_380120 [Lineolata rhizophorae]|uniref:Cyanovirin-N domain-containing protein n=1 Tax=Lineolata rhizophorae TaxID=578093 RepID=A0A6A6NYP0_9PEZI|nr:hypothetical protein BDY21DRAFT_380120 [Lineolata rhizophorae]